MRRTAGRLLATALVGLTLAGASACGTTAPDASTGPPTFTGANQLKEVCDTLVKARDRAVDALKPVSTALAQDQPSASDIAKATDDLKATFTAMHLDVAAAAELAGDPALKERIAAYQMSVEQAIVVVEGADGDKTKLASAIDLPALRSAEKAALDACN